MSGLWPIKKQSPTKTRSKFSRQSAYFYKYLPVMCIGKPTLSLNRIHGCIGLLIKSRHGMGCESPRVGHCETHKGLFGKYLMNR